MAVEFPPPSLAGRVATLQPSPLRIIGLTKAFGTKQALDGLTFEVPQGGFD